MFTEASKAGQQMSHLNFNHSMASLNKLKLSSVHSTKHVLTKILHIVGYLKGLGRAIQINQSEYLLGSSLSLKEKCPVGSWSVDK